MVGPDSTTIGTFAVYHGHPHEPTDRERLLVDRFTHFASVAIDHSRLVALRQSHREAELARQFAEEHSRSKSALLTSVSHEIRTPLQAIRGFTELLSTMDLEPERRSEALARINTAADHLLSLVTDVLDLSRAEAGALPLRPVPVEVASSVDEVVDLTSTLAADWDITVRVRLVDEDRVLADPDRLRQVLLNILGNALRHGDRLVHRVSDLPSAGPQPPSGRPTTSFRSVRNHQLLAGIVAFTMLPASSTQPSRSNVTAETDHVRRGDREPVGKSDTEGVAVDDVEHLAGGQ